MQIVFAVVKYYIIMSNSEEFGRCSRSYEEAVQGEIDTHKNRSAYADFDSRILDMFSHSTGFTVVLMNACQQAGYLKKNVVDDVKNAMTRCRLPALSQYLYAEFYDSACEEVVKGKAEKDALKEFLANAFVLYEAINGFKNYIDSHFDSAEWNLEGYGDLCIDFTRCRNLAVHNLLLPGGQAIVPKPGAEKELQMPAIGCLGSRVTPAYIDVLRCAMSDALCNLKRDLNSELDGDPKEHTLEKEGEEDVMGEGAEDKGTMSQDPLEKEEEKREVPMGGC